MTRLYQQLPSCSPQESERGCSGVWMFDMIPISSIDGFSYILRQVRLPRRLSVRSLLGTRSSLCLFQSSLPRRALRTRGFRSKPGFYCQAQESSGDDPLE